MNVKKLNEEIKQVLEDQTINIGDIVNYTYQGGYGVIVDKKSYDLSEVETRPYLDDPDGIYLLDGKDYFKSWNDTYIKDNKEYVDVFKVKNLITKNGKPAGNKIDYLFISQIVPANDKKSEIKMSMEKIIKDAQAILDNLK